MPSALRWRHGLAIRVATQVSLRHDGAVRRPSSSEIASGLVPFEAAPRKIARPPGLTEALRRQVRRMRYGTADFYVAVATVIPVLFLAEVLSLHSWRDLGRFQRDWNDRLYVPEQRYLGVVLGMVAAAPVVAVVTGVGGEIAAFHALYSGTPNILQRNGGSSALRRVIGAVWTSAVVHRYFVWIHERRSRHVTVDAEPDA
jgi:hypothetical protein